MPRTTSSSTILATCCVLLVRITRGAVSTNAGPRGMEEEDAFTLCRRTYLPLTRSEGGWGVSCVRACVRTRVSACVHVAALQLPQVLQAAPLLAGCGGKSIHPHTKPERGLGAGEHACLTLVLPGTLHGG